MPLARHPARRARARLALGDALQHLGANPHQFPDFAGMVAAAAGAGVRTVVWVTPWVNLERPTARSLRTPARSGCTPAPRPTTRRASVTATTCATPTGTPFVARWWMGAGSPIDFTSEAAEAWWREQAKRALEMGVEGIKADDGEGYYIPDDARFADGTHGRPGGVAPRGPATAARCNGRSTRSTPGAACCSGAAAGRASRRTEMLWGGDQASDFWSLRALVAAAISAAARGSRTGRTTWAATSATPG